MNLSIEKKSVKKGRWCREDDELLRELVDQEPSKPRWRAIAEKFGGSRNGKQCRERYENHLKCGIRKRRFSSEESELIHLEVEKCKPEPPKWAAISSLLKDCTPLMVRNHVNNGRRRKKAEIKKRRKVKSITKLAFTELRPKESDFSKTRMSVKFLLN